MTFTCPVCKYDKMDAPPRNYEICSCCGTEFGNDDQLRTHDQLREEWIRSGAHWFFREPPVNWNPWRQLTVGGFSRLLAGIFGRTRFALFSRRYGFAEQEGTGTNQLCSFSSYCGNRAVNLADSVDTFTFIFANRDTAVSARGNSIASPSAEIESWSALGSR
jgi:hypothetical protein